MCQLLANPDTELGQGEERISRQNTGRKFLLPAENTIVDFTVTSSKNDDIKKSMEPRQTEEKLPSTSQRVSTVTE